MSPHPAFLLLLLCGVAASASTRESFNRGWRFERFGPMPDGSVRAEPGAAGWTIQVTASSQETDKGNLAELAMDGDPDTRWCAAGAGLGQWIQLDLGRPQAVAGVDIEWEFPDLSYGAEAEGSYLWAWPFHCAVGTKP